MSKAMNAFYIAAKVYKMYLGACTYCRSRR